MVIKRPFWQNLIETFWKERSIIWLMGIRRVGKTSLCASLSDVMYFDCEQRVTRDLLKNYELFLTAHKGKRLILDEIHCLDNPSEILKVAADHYPEVKIIATGSSTLGASKKFKDTLTGRKRQVWLTPILLDEVSLFGSYDLNRRFLFGGLPEFFVSSALPERDFREWFDGYWAKDIEALFSVGKKHSFQKFAELLFAQSGGMFEATRFTESCEVSRQTIMNYLAILEITFVVHVIRPFSTHKPTEITSAPKVYGFDTGFVCYSKGWSEIRKEDTGILWEHVVLNELNAYLQGAQVNYWRDKRGREIDFVLRNRGDSEFTVIECKFNSSSCFGSTSAMKAMYTNIAAFREHYATGKNYVVVSDLVSSVDYTIEGVTISFVSPAELVKQLAGLPLVF